ncbi:MAG TPA: hypothetical protein VFV44_09825, partial [Nitrospiraceae bacterium]|nr:hypothetical protein [Nitrospiraceae bacterium]
EMIELRERRLWSWSNAIWVVPLCEASPSRRGRGPHHAQMDRVGTWDIPRLAVSCSRRRPHREGEELKADDARAREVGLRHSVCLTVDASGGLKSHSARGPGPISEGGGNASPAREDGRYGEASEAQRRKPGNG